MTKVRLSVNAEHHHKSRENKVSEEFPELFHYTNLGGLKGILSSQTIRATKFNALNDLTEIDHFRDYLTIAVGELTRRAVIEDRRRSLSEKLRLDKLGGPLKVHQDDIRNFIDKTYKATFIGEDSQSSIFSPFLASFCNHSEEQQYEKTNGLLSQWRGYGNVDGGRFAIVFDTQSIERKLNREAQAFNYAHLQLADVIYNDSTLKFDDRFHLTIKSFSDAFLKILADISDGKNASKTELVDLIASATRFKHQGFREEREIRIIACPWRNDQIEETPTSASSTNGKPKKIKLREFDKKDGQDREFLTLFDQPKGKLPIKRIIVGPGHSQKIDLNHAQNLAGSEIKIVASETPFIG